jgi:hypothetical protein
MDRCSAFVHVCGMGDTVQPGHLLARGVARGLRGHDFISLAEFVPRRGLRVDVLALGPKGQVWVVECKSSRADFTSDHKWRGYLEWCDRFFWAVDPAFPVDLLPGDTGLILADAYGAEIMRMGIERPLAPARRRAITQKMARTAANRLLALLDSSSAPMQSGPAISLLKD